MGTTSAIHIRVVIDMTIVMAIVDRVTLVAARALAEVVMVSREHGLVITTRRGAV